MKSIYYQQNKLFQAWFWVAYIPIILLLLINFSKPSERSLDNIAFVLALVLLPLALLLSLRFKLTIDSGKITYQYFPIHLAPRSLYWSEVESAQLVFFDPIKHYWGYGYRNSHKYGMCYNTKGNIGLLIKTKNQKILNLEITDQAGFSQFVKENGLVHINLNIINLEDAIKTIAI
ncbi:MAG: hypothetical protein RIR11_2208 [Bacteroidota bacterium]|jgi:hypothetical protein